MIEEHFLGERRPLAQGKQLEHLVFLAGQMHARAVHFHGLGVEIDHEIAGLDDRLGMASKWNRAATSAMRPEPLVMTTKFTITRIVKTMIPMTKLPFITKLPKASITWPAADVPS